MAEEERAGVVLTHLDGPLRDGDSTPKRVLVDYLDAMADRLVPALRDRPLSVVRVRPGSAPFMQKNLPASAPDWIAVAPIWAERSRRTVRYPLCQDRRTLLWLANQRAVEFHPGLIPIGSTRQTHLVLDLDPPEGAPFPAVVAVAHLVRRVLQDCGLDGAVKTSGAKGLHVLVPVQPGIDVPDLAAAGRALAARVAVADPSIATDEFVVADRGGRVFVDSTRVGGATVAAVWSPRARPGLPVSFPLDWSDLAGVDPAHYTVHTVPALVGDTDPWQQLMPAPQLLPADLVAQGHTIPVARVRAMHEGRRRARAARATERDDRP